MLESSELFAHESMSKQVDSSELFKNLLRYDEATFQQWQKLYCCFASEELEDSFFRANLKPSKNPARICLSSLVDTETLRRYGNVSCRLCIMPDTDHAKGENANNLFNSYTKIFGTCSCFHSCWYGSAYSYESGNCTNSVSDKPSAHPLNPLTLSAYQASTLQKKKHVRTRTCRIEGSLCSSD